MSAKIQAYIGQMFQLATPYDEGLANDHIDISPEMNCGAAAKFYNDKSRLKYHGVLRKDYCKGDGPNDTGTGSSRKFNSVTEIFGDFETVLPLEEAIERAERIAKHEGVAVLVQREYSDRPSLEVHREIHWHPENWTPMIM